MPAVNVPGVGTLQFPDGMSQDDMSAAIQKNFPQLTTPTTQHPQDSQFLTDIKGLGNEAARVGIKAITGLPLMAADAATGVGNLLTKGNLGNKADYPGQIYDQNLDSTFAPPTTRSGKISEGLSTLVASLFAPGPDGVRTAGDLKVPLQSLTGADAVKAEAMRAAKQADVVIPPSLTKNPPTGSNLANGYGGSAETLKAARDVNTPKINALIATDNGLDAGSSLTKPAITGQITDAVKAGYEPIRNIGEIPVDGAHRAFVANLTKADRGAANISPTLGNPKIAELADALMPPSTARVASRTPLTSSAVKGSTDALGLPLQDSGLGSLGGAATDVTPSFLTRGGRRSSGPAVDNLTLGTKTPSYDSGDLVDAISALRAKAADAYAGGERQLGKAYKQAATGYESLIDRYLQSQRGDPDAEAMLAKFRIARTQIAKGHDALSALNPATGDIDPRVLASLDEGQLTGGTKQAATIARAFPDAVVPSKGTPAGVTAFQGNMAPEALAAGPGGVVSTVSGMLGRNAARNYALSKRAQEALMQPKGKTLTRSALDGVFSNPAAFGALYEDAQ